VSVSALHDTSFGKRHGIQVRVVGPDWQPQPGHTGDNDCLYAQAFCHPPRSHPIGDAATIPSILIRRGESDMPLFVGIEVSSKNLEACVMVRDIPRRLANRSASRMRTHPVRGLPGTAHFQHGIRRNGLRVRRSGKNLGTQTL